MARSSVERLANWILTEARRDSAQETVVIPFDRGTLASHIGTTRENLSRNLALLTEHGVRVRGREIVMDRKDLLEVFAVRSRCYTIRPPERSNLRRRTIDPRRKTTDCGFI